MYLVYELVYEYVFRNANGGIRSLSCKFRLA